ncbi:MAG: helix-turn-helix transcriptional regulator [Firmicutes bacterium]|nr:helix-turn-helix transcriptional regulator [Bacillota bacterium]
MKEIVFTLEQQLKKSEIGQRELSRRTKGIDPEGVGVRQALISEICRNQVEHIPVKKLALICTVLECDLSEVMKLKA